MGINKMDCDTAGYKQARYEEIRNEMKNMLMKVGWKKDYVEKAVPVVPISGQGLTLVHVSAQLLRFVRDRGCAEGLGGLC